jgi:guanylate kinase
LTSSLRKYNIDLIKRRVNMKKGLLIILSGPSGVGKGTVREKLFEDATLNLAYSISMTTRSPRPGEKNGREYFFVTKEEFEKKIEEGGLLEHAQFVGNYYGTPKAYVDQLLSEGKNVLLEIEVQGALQVMDKAPDALTIFLVPPTMEELEKRIRGRRTEEENIVQERLNKAAKEIATKDNYKHVVVNNTVEQAASEIAEIIKENIAQH